WKPGAFEMRPFAPRDSNVVHSHEPRRHGGTEVKTASLQDSKLRDSVPPWFVDEHPKPQVVLALRRFRHAIPARVRVKDGSPEYVAIDRRGLSGGGVESCAGPWRTSGGWWEGEPHQPHQTHQPSQPHSPRVGWDRDEWDVTVAGGTTYRLFRARDTDRWFVDGVID